MFALKFVLWVVGVEQKSVLGMGGGHWQSPGHIKVTASSFCLGGEQGVFLIKNGLGWGLVLSGWS